MHPGASLAARPSATLAPVLLAPDARQAKRERDARYRARRRARQNALDQLAARLTLTSRQQRSWLAEIVADELQRGRLRHDEQGALAALRSLELLTCPTNQNEWPRPTRSSG